MLWNLRFVSTSSKAEIIVGKYNWIKRTMRKGKIVLFFFNLLYCKSIYRLALAQKKGGLSYSWLIMICLNSSMKFIKGISHRSLVDNHQISKLQLLICQIMIFDKFDDLFCQAWQLVNAMCSIHCVSLKIEFCIFMATELYKTYLHTLLQPFLCLKTLNFDSW